MHFGLGVFVSLLSNALFPILILDQKSILTDNDWKKLWTRNGINADSKLDNNLDSSDSPMFEDSEVSRKLNELDKRTERQTDRATERLLKQLAQLQGHRTSMKCNEVCFKFKLN